MAKAALLVDYSIRTRVIVDIPDNLIGQAGDDDATYLRIAEVAKKKLNAFHPLRSGCFVGDSLTEDSEGRRPFRIIE